MTAAVLTSLLSNAATLLAMVVVFDVATGRQAFHGRPLRQFLTGVVLGIFGIALIQSSYRLETGIVFDTRSVLLGLSGLFFGVIPTSVAMALTAAYRLHQGGVAAWPGTAVIVATGCLGIVWRRYRQGQLADISWRELFVFGVIAHIVMLSLMLLLPKDAAWRVLEAIAPPVLLIYPLATTLLGGLLANRLRRERATAELKVSEERYRHLNHLYAALSRVNQVTVSAVSRDALLVDVCRALAEFERFRLVWIGWVDPATQAVTPVAQAGDGGDYLTDLRVFAEDRPEGRGPTGLCLREGRTQVCNDFATDPRLGPWRAAGARERFRASIALPVREGGVVRGALMAYSGEENVFGADVVALLEQTVSDLSSAIDHLETDRLRRVAEERARRLFAETEASRRILLSMVEDLQQSEGALRESEERFRRAVVDAPFPILLHAEDGEIIALSTAWCEISGYAREELVTVGDWTERAYGARKIAIQTSIERLFALDHRQAEGDYTIRARSGAELIWEFSSAPLGRLPDGRRLVISMAADVTDERRATQEVVRLNAELERRVTERTAQLEAANKELEAFSYSVSHDLRAPLRAVDGYTHILLEDHAPRLNAEGQRVCEVVSRSAREMGTLIDDLLSFSRAGRTAFRRSPVNMESLVRSLFVELTTPGDRERIDFRVDPLPTVDADPPLVRQVWVNLLANAIKFSAKRPRATIAVSAAAPDGNVVYSVRDNGAGFDMQYVGKLFGVFQRLHSTKEFEGTGVGLAIVQRIVHRHGGRIWAEGEVGKGAVFHFTIDDATQPKGC